MKPLKSTIGFVKEVAQEVSEDEVPSMSGAIAYFAVLSLPPLLAVTVLLAGIVFPDEVIEGLITGETAEVLGEETAAQIGTMLQQARDVAPQQARYHPLMRSTVGVLVRRQRKAPEGLVTLARWAGIVPE
jgi:uncharacterized BrkB/YihY/UPF0761 family membrane protein